MHRAWRPAAAFICAALAVCGAAGAARAGTATGRPAQFAAAGDETNDLTVEAGSGGAVQFIDAAEPIGAALPWCLPFPLGQALCDPDGDPRDTDGGGVRVDLGGGDDRAVVRFIPGSATHPGRISVVAGAGSDLVENRAFGAIRLDGGEGDDTLSSGRSAGAYLLGGPGADTLISTGDCCAVAGYSDHDTTGVGVSVTLDGKANDGAPGEHDNVRTNDVVGSPGPDIVTGGAHADSLTGGGGRDVIDGGAGNDAINATLQYAQSFESPHSVDGPDDVHCGSGSDDVDADADDEVAVDCEHIRIGAPVIPALVLAKPSGRADRKGVLRLTYRVRAPNTANAALARSSVRLVDRQGVAVSSTARFVLGARTNVARLRVTLKRATRARLSRSRAGSLRLIVQRVSRNAGPAPTAAGGETFHVPLTVRRARRR